MPVYMNASSEFHKRGFIFHSFATINLQHFAIAGIEFGYIQVDDYIHTEEGRDILRMLYPFARVDEWLEKKGGTSGD